MITNTYLRTGINSESTALNADKLSHDQRPCLQGGQNNRLHEKIVTQTTNFIGSQGQTKASMASSNRGINLSSDYDHIDITTKDINALCINECSNTDISCLTSVLNQCEDETTKNVETVSVSSSSKQLIVTPDDLLYNSSQQQILFQVPPQKTNYNRFKPTLTNGKSIVETDSALFIPAFRHPFELLETMSFNNNSALFRVEKIAEIIAFLLHNKPYMHCTLNQSRHPSLLESNQFILSFAEQTLFCLFFSCIYKIDILIAALKAQEDNIEGHMITMVTDGTLFELTSLVLTKLIDQDTRYEAWHRKYIPDNGLKIVAYINLTFSRCVRKRWYRSVYYMLPGSTELRVSCVAMKLLLNDHYKSLTFLDDIGSTSDRTFSLISHAKYLGAARDHAPLTYSADTQCAFPLSGGVIENMIIPKALSGSDPVITNDIKKILKNCGYNDNGTFNIQNINDQYIHGDHSFEDSTSCFLNGTIEHHYNSRNSGSASVLTQLPTTDVIPVRSADWGTQAPLVNTNPIAFLNRATWVTFPPLYIQNARTPIMLDVDDPQLWALRKKLFFSLQEGKQLYTWSNEIVTAVANMKQELNINKDNIVTVNRKNPFKTTGMLQNVLRFYSDFSSWNLARSDFRYLFNWYKIASNMWPQSKDVFLRMTHNMSGRPQIFDDQLFTAEGLLTNARRIEDSSILYNYGQGVFINNIAAADEAQLLLRRCYTFTTLDSFISMKDADQNNVPFNDGWKSLIIPMTTDMAKDGNVLSYLMLADPHYLIDFMAYSYWTANTTPSDLRSTNDQYTFTNGGLNYQTQEGRKFTSLMNLCEPVQRNFTDDRRHNCLIVLTDGNILDYPDGSLLNISGYNIPLLIDVDPVASPTGNVDIGLQIDLLDNMSIRSKTFGEFIAESQRYLDFLKVKDYSLLEAISKMGNMSIPCQTDCFNQTINFDRPITEWMGQAPTIDTFQTNYDNIDFALETTDFRIRSLSDRSIQNAHSVSAAARGAASKSLVPVIPFMKNGFDMVLGDRDTVSIKFPDEVTLLRALHIAGITNYDQPMSDTSLQIKKMCSTAKGMFLFKHLSSVEQLCNHTFLSSNVTGDDLTEFCQSENQVQTCIRVKNILIKNAFKDYMERNDISFVTSGLETKTHNQVAVALVRTNLGDSSHIITTNWFLATTARLPLLFQDIPINDVHRSSIPRCYSLMYHFRPYITMPQKSIDFMRDLKLSDLSKETANVLMEEYAMKHNPKGRQLSQKGSILPMTGVKYFATYPFLTYYCNVGVSSTSLKRFIWDHWSKGTPSTMSVSNIPWGNASLFNEFNRTRVLRSTDQYAIRHPSLHTMRNTYSSQSIRFQRPSQNSGFTFFGVVEDPFIITPILDYAHKLWSFTCIRPIRNYVNTVPSTVDGFKLTLSDLVIAQAMIYNNESTELLPMMTRLRSVSVNGIVREDSIMCSERHTKLVSEYLVSTKVLSDFVANDEDEGLFQ